MATLNTAVKSDLTSYLEHLAGRVKLAVRTLPEDKLWVKPYPYGTSLGNMVLHLTGNLSFHIGARLANTGYVRDRDFEFADPGGYPADEILRRFEEAVRLTSSTLAALDEAALAAPLEGVSPYHTVYGQFLVCTAHLNYHLGQIYYLLQSFGVDTGEAPMW